MGEQNIIISSITKKESKTGKPYWAVVTNDGSKLSCWDADIALKLSENEGNTIKVAVLKNDKYTNIMEFISVVKKSKSEIPTQSNNSSYELSYAKDILVAMITKDEKVDILEASKIAAQCVKNIKEVLHEDEDNKESNVVEGNDEADY